jgi:carboxymethylenebutenolidase
MYEEHQGPIDSLVHLYVDGAFNRRELVRRVAKYTGSITAAVTALRGYEVWGQTATACPADVRVPLDAPDLIAQDVTYPGDGTTMMGHLAYPKNPTAPYLPGVIVIHENRGLVDHIKDVTRRVARAGFVALAPDLLSRQGGVANFPDPQQQQQAYGRTLPAERQADLISTLTHIKTLPNIVHDRIGVVGFCAGGGNTWNLVSIAEELRAAVPYYGAPVPTVEQIDRIQTPVLAIYGERDRNLTISMAPVMQNMIQRQKAFGFIVYEGAAHAFHNDTGANYNAEAACDAWSRTIAWFNRYLRQ